LVNWLKNFVNGLEKDGFMKDIGERWLEKPTWIDYIKF